MRKFNFRRDVLRVSSIYGVLVFLMLSYVLPSESSAEELPATLSIQVELDGDFSDIPWEQSRMTVYLLDDRQDTAKQIVELQDESKGQLEPLIKEYMYSAELLTRLAGQQEKSGEREKAFVSFREREAQIQHILDEYAARIDRIFQEQTLQIRREEGIAVERIEFRDIPAGPYRVYAVLTCATTTLRWFEAFSVEGGDRALSVLTRENLNNPYWTDLNWWSFINLDFSKHH